MSLLPKTRVLLGRALSGGTGITEFYPHALWFQIGVEMGLIKGIAQINAPTDTTLIWFDPDDTTQTPGGTTKKWNGSAWVVADTLTQGTIGGTIVDAQGGLLPSPANGTYVFLARCPYPFTLEGLAGVVTAGSLTMQVVKNGTPVGTTRAVTTVLNNSTQASIAFAANDSVGIVISSSTGASNLSFTLTIKRPL